MDDSLYDDIQAMKEEFVKAGQLYDKVSQLAGDILRHLSGLGLHEDHGPAYENRTKVGRLSIIVSFKLGKSCLVHAPAFFCICLFRSVSLAGLLCVCTCFTGGSMHIIMQSRIKGAILSYSSHSG